MQKTIARNRYPEPVKLLLFDLCLTSLIELRLSILFDEFETVSNSSRFLDLTAMMSSSSSGMGSNSL